MEITISESVKKQLIKESMIDDFKKILNRIASVGEKSMEESDLMGKFDTKFLLSWSATIGGFIGPLNDFIAGREHNLTQGEIMAISIGVAATLFYNNQKLVSKILNRIKELGLIDTFKMALEKGKELKGALISFLESIGITTSNLLHVASFTFIIPTVGVFIGMAENSQVTYEDISEIAERIIAANVTRHSAVIVKNAVKSIFEKLRGKIGIEESRS